MQTFSSAHAAALADVSYRQLDYWCRARVLACTEPATGSGSRRRFSAQEVALLRLCQRLASLGADTAVMARVVAAVYDLPTDLWSGVLLVWPNGRVALGGLVRGACWAVELDQLPLADSVAGGWPPPEPALA